MNENAPTIGRVVAAIFIAAGAAALPAMSFGALAIFAFLVGYVIALLHIAVLGLPIYMLLRRHRSVGWVVAAGAGLAVGVAPVGVILIAMGTATGSSIASGVGTAGFCGLCGMLGGLAFRGVAGSAVPPRFNPAIWE